MTERIIECVIRVHQKLGPGFMEKIYRRALLIELRKRGVATETEKTVVILYDGVAVGRHRLDLLAGDEVVIELKTVERLCKKHYAQVRSYLQASGLRTVLLVNFAGELADFRRVTPLKVASPNRRSNHPDPQLHSASDRGESGVSAHVVDGRPSHYAG